MCGLMPFSARSTLAKQLRMPDEIAVERGFSLSTETQLPYFEVTIPRELLSARSL